MTGFESFIDIDVYAALDVIFLGFVGGVLSGFIGTGGAFFMTPGMMNLGVPGVIAVGSNITHKFGKAIMGAKRHGELGHVDKKLGLYMLITAVIGVRLAVWINKELAMKTSVGEDNVVGDLYISVLYVVVLSFISIPMLIDALNFEKKKNRSRRSIAGLLAKIRLRPLIYFKTADVTLSFWLIAIIGLLTGFLAGSIGVGGFLGVPAMIYIFGVPTAVAAGTELFLAIFMGAWGAVNYAWSGYVDLRLVFLLYLGSMTGIYVGVYGMRVVKERMIRMITGIIIAICVVSRAVSIPVYLTRMEYLHLSPHTVEILMVTSKFVLFSSGTVGVTVILLYVVRAYRRGRALRRLLKNNNH